MTINGNTIAIRVVFNLIKEQPLPKRDNTWPG